MYTYNVDSLGKLKKIAAKFVGVSLVVLEVKGLKWGVFKTITDCALVFKSFFGLGEK